MSAPCLPYLKKSHIGTINNNFSTIYTNSDTTCLLNTDTSCLLNTNASCLLNTNASCLLNTNVSCLLSNDTPYDNKSLSCSSSECFYNGSKYNNKYLIDKYKMRNIPNVEKNYFPTKKVVF